MRGRFRLAMAAVAALSLGAAVLPARSILLQASVEHSERLKPVTAALAPGEVYDKKNLPPMPDSTVANRWFKIPAFLAGKWHKDSQTDYFRYDFNTKETDVTTRVEEAKADGMWGTQADETGQVWQFDATPFVSTVDSGDQMVVQIMHVSVPVEMTEQYFLRRSVDTEIRVDKATNIIKSVECGEQITAYIPEGPGLIKRESSSKVFDRFGQPKVLGKSFAYEKLVAKFAPTDTYNGKDLRPLFQQFLTAQKSASQ